MWLWKPSFRSPATEKWEALAQKSVTSVRPYRETGGRDKRWLVSTIQLDWLRQQWRDHVSHRTLEVSVYPGDFHLAQTSAELSHWGLSWPQGRSSRSRKGRFDRVPSATQGHSHKNLLPPPKALSWFPILLSSAGWLWYPFKCGFLSYRSKDGWLLHCVHTGATFTNTLKFSGLSPDVQASILAVSLRFLSSLCSHWCLFSK